MSRISLRAVTALFILMVAASVSASAQRKDDKKGAEGGLSNEQRQELLPLFRLVDEVMKGAAPGTYLVNASDKEQAPSQAAPETVTLTWRNDFLKAQGGQIFVPFSVQIPPGALGSSIAGYLRVAPKGSTGITPPEGKSNEKKDDDKKGQSATQYPFEDVYFTELRPTPGQPLKLTRAFAVPPGEYDVYVALRDRAVAGAKDKEEAPVKVTVHKQELTVPDFHSNELQTSSIIVADKIEQLSSPVAPEAQKERPYVLGDTEIVPAQDLQFKKSEELQVVFQIYGAQFGEDKKPDVTVEYVFHQKDGTGEKPFNKTAPQAFTGQTLPPNFDPDQGHQLVAGQAVPLASFPEGDFRLEIKITDNKAQKSITRDVNFTVVAS
ncbi:MAG TPA: hypothetical protein VIL35_08075 [Vicinamibacterales bacterium]